MSLSATFPCSTAIPVSSEATDFVIDHPSCGVRESNPSAYRSATKVPPRSTTMPRVPRVALSAADRSSPKARSTAALVFASITGVGTDV